MTTETKVAKLGETVLQDTATLEMIIPGTAEPSGWVLTLAGPAHDKTVALNNAAERERLKKNAAIEAAQVNGRKWKGEDTSPEESRRKLVKGLVGRIIDWTPVDFGEGVIAFSEENAIKLFMDPAKGAYFSQLVDYLTGERAFMKGSEGG